MKKLTLYLSTYLLTLNLFSQTEFTKFEIPVQQIDSTITKSFNTSNCESCNAALDPALLNKTIYYKQSNLRDWLYQYFKSNEEQRKTMKNNANSNINLGAVVKSIPIKFGYSSNQSKDYNYWNKKYVEWVNTRLISVDDIAYLFKSDSADQLKAWLECKKNSCGYSAANYAEQSIFLDIEKVRNGIYNVSLTNLSIAKIKILEIQVDETLEKLSGKNFRINKNVSNKGGKVTASYSSKSKLDVNFSISLTYKIIGTDDQGTTVVTYKVKPKLPETPIGTIIATTLTYEQFLKINQIEDLSSTEQIWLPCDGRNVPNGNYITKTPDLRGLFIRGTNVMDKNEGLHTKPVDIIQSNPDNTEIGKFQKDEFKKHNHTLGDAGRAEWQSNQPTNRQRVRNDGGVGISTSFSGVSTETRPKNISVIYLIRVR